ncbi:MAG: TIM barrel protein, partial [Eudoraea sp.]|nr:TIM barrel protein [Eudoraea sp.]
MASRRTFIQKTALGAAGLTMVSTFPFSSEFSGLNDQILPKISLAQWSLHRAFMEGKLKAVDFAAISKNSFNINAVEYVSQFYVDNAKDEGFWNQMRRNAANEGVESLLIMVDDEGLLGNTNAAERKKAVEDHYKWINAAKLMGCHSIRINAFTNSNVPSEIKDALVQGLGHLVMYGAKEGIHILIENHGLHTSDADFMVGIIKEVDNPYLGTLPDFGNWCLNAEWGSTQGNTCTKIYDPYDGVSKFLPYAKGVSAKSYNFDDAGYDTVNDYPS